MRQDLMIIEGFISPGSCRVLIAAYEKGMAMGRIRPRGTCVRDLSLSLVVTGDPGLDKWARSLRDTLGKRLSSQFDLPGIFADYTAFKCEYEGGAHPPHADNVTAAGEPNHTYWRDVTAMLYLNDGRQDFEGGRLKFVRLQREFVPKPGLLVGFGCGLDFEHEVTPILGGTRYSIAFWFTRDPKWREYW
jgi:hypothetical protein